MAAVSSVCFPLSSRESTCLHQDPRDSSPAQIKSPEAVHAPSGAASPDDKDTSGVKECKMVSPYIDGSDGHSVLGSLPSWTRFFFTRRSYQSLPVVGVITAQQLSQLHTNAAATVASCDSSARPPVETVLVAGAATSPASSKSTAATADALGASFVRDAPASPSSGVRDGTSVANLASPADTVPERAEVTAANVRSDATTAADTAPHVKGGCASPSTSHAKCNAAPAASGAADTPATRAGSEGVDDEDSYWHLLHDTLVLHGGVSDLQYFVSTDESGEFLDESGTAGSVVSTDLAATKTEQKQTRLSGSTAAARGTVIDGEEEDARNHPRKPLLQPAEHKPPGSALEKHEQSPSREPQVILRPLSPPEGVETARHLLTLCRVSRRVCGHKGVTHGGLIATLLDNAMGYFAVLLMPRPATKSLTVNYLKPLLAESYVLVEIRKVERGGTSNNSTGSQSERCRGQPGTSDRNAGTVDNRTCGGSNSRDGGASRMPSCTLEGKVYACIPKQMRAAFPPKRESPSAARSQGDHEPSNAQQGTTSNGSIHRLKSEQCDENNSCVTSSRSSTDDGSVDCSVSREHSGSCTENSTSNTIGTRQENRHTTHQTDNSFEGGCSTSSHEKPLQPPRATRSGESLPSGVWLVATAEAIFVDVSSKWKSLA